METKIERLHKISKRIISLENHVSVYNINEVDNIIQNEFNIEFLINPDYYVNFYLNDIRQTIEETLHDLLESKDGSTLQRKLYNEILSKFKADIFSELGRLESKM